MKGGVFLKLIVVLLIILPSVFASVVINEVETNPINESEEYVELYNDGLSDVNISGWMIIDSGSDTDTIPDGTIISSKDFFVFEESISSLSFNNNDSITLQNSSGDIIDQTAFLNDPENDDKTWQRIPDGTGSFVFQAGTKGLTNDKIIIDDGVHNVPSEYLTIQEAIDTANPGDVVNVSTGTYEEDLVIPTGKDGLEIAAGGTTIKGVANVDQGDWPLAAPNIEILSDDVKIHGFTIESPDYESLKYTSGIVIGGSGVEIYDNEFVINSADFTDEISQAIQTYSKLVMPGVDVSGLKIHDNDFTHKGAGDWGYEAIYLNPDEGIGIVYIEDNNFNGKVLRAITSERSKTTIKNNEIITDLSVLPDDWSSAGAYQGINIIKYDSSTQSNIIIENNVVKGSDPSKGFNQGIRLGQTSQGFSGIDIRGNTISYNKKGIQVKVANSLFVNQNDIVNNTDYGILNEDSASLNALYNWWGHCSGPFHLINNSGGQGDKVSDNVDFKPWLGLCIVNKSENPCAFETEDVILTADLIGEDINKCWVSYNINGTNLIKNGNIIAKKCQASILASELVGGQNITWNVFANDSLGNVYHNGEKSFYVRERTFLGVIPWPADGINNWFVTEPTFTLTNDPLGGAMYYEWDSIGELLYTGPFDLENIPNAPPKQSAGTLQIKWWSEFGVCGNETPQEITLYIDLTDSSIDNLIPGDGSTVINNVRPEISAYIDEVYQGNSGVNKNSVVLKVDGVDVTAHTGIQTKNDIDALVSYTPLFADLSEGVHEVYLYVEDKAGRSSQVSWTFEIKITSIFTFMVNSPEDGAIYDSKRVQFNLSASEDLSVIEYINWNDRKPRWKRLCKDCDEYGAERIKLKSFKDGFNNISIKAIDDFGQAKEQNFVFFVDSKAPKISRTLPKKNSITNGVDFYIKYTEENLKEVSVNWNPAQIISDCNSSGRNQECDIYLDLTPFDGQYIDYYFEVSDQIHTTQSKETRVLVDTTSPEITLNMPESKTYDRKVPFNIEVSEEVSLEYIDNSDSSPRWRKLCTRCDEYGAERKKTKTFKRGAHDLTIRAFDKAGNSDEESVSFVVDY
ncbi:MAG: lamin tail domain-containing protein [archaeon]